MQAPKPSPRAWTGFVAGLAGVFAVFEWTARSLGSDRGQAGLLVCAAVVAATVVADRLVGGGTLASSVRRLGFGAPARDGLARAIIVCGLLLLVVLVYFGVTRTSFAMYPGWMLLLPGLFAQAGVAEEVLFRGYLFRHLRQGRSFWRAGLVASGPFVLVHLWLFANMHWAVALTSVLLSVSISFPLAYLFETGGNTIWGPALVHWVVQAVPKVVLPDEGAMSFALAWIVASTIIPFVVFAVPRPARSTAREGRRP